MRGLRRRNLRRRPSRSQGCTRCGKSPKTRGEGTDGTGTSLEETHAEADKCGAALWDSKTCEEQYRAVYWSLSLFLIYEFEGLLCRPYIVDALKFLSQDYAYPLLRTAPESRERVGWHAFSGRFYVLKTMDTTHGCHRVMLVFGNVNYTAHRLD